MCDKIGEALCTRLACVAILLAAIVMPTFALAANQDDNGACMACHGNEPTARQQMIYVDAGVLSGSVHARLNCTDCHVDAEETQARDEKIPHLKRLRPVNCVICHYKGNIEGAPQFSPMQQYKDSVHGRASIQRGDTDVATCSTCHGKHNIRPASDPESTIYHANIPRTCAVCHENMQLILKHNIHAERPYSEYERSVHGKALFKEGGLATLAAVCIDCHGVHDIQANGEADLKPHRPGTCGKCHLDDYEAYIRSIHGQALREGIEDAPVCSDCHGEHKIAAPWDPESRVSAFNVTSTCANCHDDVTKMSKYNILTNKVSTFMQSDHGMGKDIGIVSVATCVSCHGYHLILPSSSPNSSIYASNLEKTCGQPNCHPNPQPEILQATIHVDTEERNIQQLRLLRSIAIWLFGTLVGVSVVIGFLVFTRRLRRSPG